MRWKKEEKQDKRKEEIARRVERWGININNEFIIIIKICINITIQNN